MKIMMVVILVAYNLVSFAASNVEQIKENVSTALIGSR